MTHLLYDRLLDPREHPDYLRRAVQPPDWDTFGGTTRLIFITDFTIAENRIVDYRPALDLVRSAGLGQVYKCTYTHILAENLEELAAELRARGLFLFSLYGYVPGFGPGGLWRQYTAPAPALRLLEQSLGDHWLGMENGEQDGRYVGGYASQMGLRSADRVQQYLNFQCHFEKHGDDVGNRMTILVSLNFSHYFAKEGVYTLNGAETGQALPNSQVYYAFIRGAGKQYGLPWIGNASVFNRWGMKCYGSPPPGEPNCGPTKGTSLSLMKRLLYSHILYNSMAVGLDLYLFEDDPLPRKWAPGLGLSPLGRIQQAAGRWLARHGQPGAMVTPIALMLDFFSGWTFPRHLYTQAVYRVWGNLPYDAGDHLTDGLLDMLYPGYRDSSYYHDESGFLSPTPYGDGADCILSDAEPWLLARYALVVVAGRLTGGQEIRDKLQSYIEAGGHVVITAGSLAALPGGLAGVTVIGTAASAGPGQTVLVRGNALAEQAGFEIQPLSLTGGAQVIASWQGMPAAAQVSCAEGRLTVMASPFGVPALPAVQMPVTGGIDAPLSRPYPLLRHVQAVLDPILRERMLFEVGADLSLIVCRRGPGDYLLGISNNTWSHRPFRIDSRCGEITKVTELALDQSERGAPGHLPEGLEQAMIGESDTAAIAGGDVRVFAVEVREDAVRTVAHARPPARPRGIILPLRGAEGIKEQVLRRPTFFEHWSGVVIDWRHLRNRESEALRREAGWISRQKLRLFVDLTSGLNLYPDLRLVDNITEEHQATMKTVRDVLGKMILLDGRDIVLSLHRLVENNMTAAEAWASMESSVRQIASEARERGITVHLRLCPDKPPRDLAEALGFLERVGAENLRLAPSIGLLLHQLFAPGRDDLSQAGGQLHGRVGLWLAGAPCYDAGGQLWTVQGPLFSSGRDVEIAQMFALAPAAPVLQDAAYESQDQEYLDARVLERAVARAQAFVSSTPR